VRVFITGVRGLLGTALAEHLSAAGHEVVGSSRAVAPSGRFARHVIRLGDMPPPDMFAGTDLLIHAAYAPGKAAERTNVDGTIRIAESAIKAGVPRQLFLSSFSACVDATAGYGRMKHELEEFFTARRLEVLRPGLVLGAGGLFGSMVRLVRSLPIVPLPDGAKNRVPLVGITEFLQCVERLVAEPRRTPVNLCCPTQPTLREVLETIARAEQRGRLFVPFPTSILIGPLALAAKLGIGVGVDADSLRGYRTNVESPFESHFADFFVAEPTLEEMVRAALGPSGQR
jgi:nucleoside-diphosphate-sugar epimerase